MKKKKQNYCPHCGEAISIRPEGEIPRPYCSNCKTYFYENPLPVVSCIHCIDKSILLVKRGNKPYKGNWCLPTGFAETGESIEQAALRELQEESGIEGKIINLVDVDSVKSRHYGDLTFITYEVEKVGGTLFAGDDATEVRYFLIDKLPYLPFKSNEKAIRSFIRNKADYWAIVESFNLAKEDEGIEQRKRFFLSDRLNEVIEKNADLLAEKWATDVMEKNSTLSYRNLSKEEVFHRGQRVILQFGRWLKGLYTEKDNRDFYIQMGISRKMEGFKASEVISALSLVRKNIWEFALSQGMWEKTIDIYIVLELERRMMLFFDKAAYYLSRGYESDDSSK
jgi:ADP-ribose pyrophosphatase YjhB (NUDIX family)